MAISLWPEDTDVLSVTEFLARVRESASVRDFESIAEAAPLLKQLSNNREFVVDQLNRSLKLWPENTTSFYSVQSSILASDGPFSVRMNIWPTISPGRGPYTAVIGATDDG